MAKRRDMVCLSGNGKAQAVEKVLFADLPYTPQGAFSCPFGTIHLVPPNPMKA